MTDQREVSAVMLRDSETDEIVFEASIAGRKAPSAYPWNECMSLDAKDVATRIVSLGRQYSLTMPANEEATAALEHLLILVEDRPLQIPAFQVARGAPNDRPAADGESGHVSEPTAEQADQGPAGFAQGDLVICVFPTRRSSTGNPTPRPALVIDTRKEAGLHRR